MSTVTMKITHNPVKIHFNSVEHLCVQLHPIALKQAVERRDVLSAHSIINKSRKPA